MENRGHLHSDNLRKDINHCLKAFNNQGIILYPTDTIWGLGCDASKSEPIRKIYALKHREEKKSLIILVSDVNMIGKYVEKPSAKLLSYLAHTTRPTTAIFQGARNLPDNLINEDGSIAIRITNDQFCSLLITELNKPIVSTSANISGAPFPGNFDDVSSAIKNGVDYIVQHRQNDKTPAAPSKIIRINDQEEIEFLR